MKEIQLPSGVSYLKDLMVILKEQGVEHTYFSGKNVIAFVNDEDASMFMLQHGGNMKSALEEFRKQFSRIYVQ
jgi:hypothetical protein